MSSGSLRTSDPPTSPGPGGASPPAVSSRATIGSSSSGPPARSIPPVWADWIGPAVIAVLFCWLFASVIVWVLRAATNAPGQGLPSVLLGMFTSKWNPDWSHAVVVPLISLYYLYQQRRHLAALPRRLCWPGLGLMLVGVLGFLLWIYPGRNNMLQGYSMILALFGLVLFLHGWGRMSVFWFPVAFLLFAVKISESIWERIAWKLQIVAAHASTFVLKVVGLVADMDAEVRGATIDLWSNGQKLDPLNVAEACSGLRMLMAFVSLGVAMAFLAPRPWWQRLGMVFLTIPIAILVNVGRVSTIGFLYAKVNPELASGDIHTFIGMLMLVPAAGLFFLVGWIMDRLVLHDDEPSPHPAAPKPGAPGAGASAPDSLPLLKSGAPGAPGASAPDSRSPAAILLGLFAGLLLALPVAGLYIGVMALLAPQRFAEALDIGVDPGPALGLAFIAAAALAFALGAGVARLGLRRSASAIATRPPPPHPPHPPHPSHRHLGAAVAAGALLLSAAGLYAWQDFNQWVLVKLPLPLREPLYRIGSELGSWKLLRDDPPLPAEQVEVLGTELYLSRWYADRSLPEDAPGAVVRLHVAYYTGTPDTVPHVPDRCFVGGGMQRLDAGDTTLALQGSRYYEIDDLDGRRRWVSDQRFKRQPPEPYIRLPQMSIPARIFTYAHPAAPDRPQNVIYFFVANGKYLAGPNEVRLEAFNPRDRYAYYCKVEVQLPNISDSRFAAQRAGEFLSAAMPDILACLPDWIQANRSDHPDP